VAMVGIHVFGGTGNTPKITCNDLTKLIRSILDFMIIMML